MLADEWREEDRFRVKGQMRDGLGPGCLLQEEREIKGESMRVVALELKFEGQK